MNTHSTLNENISFRQRSICSGSQEFFLNGLDSIIIKINKITKSEQWGVNLSHIHPEPKVFKNKYFQSLFVAFGFFAFGSFIGWGALNTKTDFDMYGLGAIALFFYFVAAICIGMYINNSREVVIFFNGYTGEPAIILWKNIPNEKLLFDFIKRLSERLIYIQNHRINANRESITDEIRKLDNLRREGIISHNEFNSAKENLLKLIENQAK